MTATAYRDARTAARAMCDPLKFCRLCWPDMQIYGKQREVLQSVHDNYQTFVHAANETGKTRIAAVCALWFFATREPARVSLFASAQHQLETVLWPELRYLMETSRVPFPFRTVTNKIQKWRDSEQREIMPLSHLHAHVTTEVERFHGVHLPHDRPRILVIFDEASAVPDAFLEGAESFAHRILVLGNPLNTTNFFYRCCKLGDVADPTSQRSLLRKVIHIGGEHSPNVMIGRARVAKGLLPGDPVIPGLLSYSEYVQRRELWDDVQATMRLDGHFYEGAAMMMFPSAWLDTAMDQLAWRSLVYDEYGNNRKRDVEAMGVDVAEGGRDLTVWTTVDHYGVIEQIAENVKNTMDVADRTVSMIREFRIPPNRVAIDQGGGGKVISDYLLTKCGLRCTTVFFGEAAGDRTLAAQKKSFRETDPTQAYKNRRAEMYGMTRQAIRPNEDGSFLLPPDAMELRRELEVIPMLFDQEGRVMLPPKDAGQAKATNMISMRSILKRSPDRADSLVLAIYALRRGRGKPAMITEQMLEVDENKRAAYLKASEDKIAAMRAKLSTGRKF